MKFLHYIFNLPVTKQDKVSGGYIAYYYNSDVVSQGETKEEALENLKEDLRIVEKFKDSVKENKTYVKKPGTKTTVAHS